MTTDFQEMADSLLIDNSPQEEADDPEPQEAPGEDETREEETAEAEAEDVEAEEDEEGEEPEASDDEDVDTEEDDGDEQPATYTVKVDGEEKQVTLDDLKRAYSGQDYIQKGMQEAAAKRKEVEQMYSQAQAYEQQLMQAYQQVQETGFIAPPTPPDASKVDTDPIGYMQDRARYDQEMQAYQDQQQKLYALQQQHSQREQQTRQAFLEEQKQRVTQLVPELGDAEKAPEFQRKLVATATDAYGLTQEELANVVDARHVQVLADAMRWREMQAAKTGKKKTPEPKKSVKPVGRRQPTQMRERKKLEQRAKRSGRPEDFVDLLLEPKKG